MPLPAGSAADICDAPLCRTRRQVEIDQQHSASLRAKREMMRQRRFARARSLLATLAARLGGTNWHAIPTTIVPMIDGKPTERAPDEIERLTSRIDALLDRVFADHDASVALPDEIGERRALSAADPPALNAACIACGGHCCLLGLFRMAFLTEKDIARFRADNPAMTRDEIRAAYIGRIPERSVRNSCLYHGATGCALPREMRALTCNRWQCGPRFDLSRQIDEYGTGGSVVLALAEDHEDFPQAGASLIRAVTVDGNGRLRFHDDLELPPMTAGVGPEVAI
ncbi:hypothetical protein [Tropicimonas sp.]|uniref:hypothetical protein n=1 Tax=Tropicimonas sp. TaxID=2067044 RepID=UPI003A8A67C5